MWCPLRRGSAEEKKSFYSTQELVAVTLLLKGRYMPMSSNLEDWETQQEAKHAAAHKEGPLDFLAGGGAVASRREQEERRVSDTLAKEAEKRHKKLVEASMKGLRDATFPDEIAHFRDVLLKLNLTPTEQEELRKLLWEKFR
jgi:hypothetical protein